MTHRIPRTIAILLALNALGCDEAEEAATTEPAPPETPAVAEPTPEPPPPPPEGWEELEVEIQGHPFTTIAPIEEQRVSVSERATAIYGSLPGESYPYWFSLRHHDEEPSLRSVLNKRGLEQEDTDFGYRAEWKEEDGSRWAYAVYSDAEQVSCTVRLSASSISDELIAQARLPCDRLAE